MKILIACEFSGEVRNAFSRYGHDAWSCDILPSATPGNHIQGDVYDVLYDPWDMLIGFPPCTHLCISGARWFAEKVEEQAAASAFFMSLVNAPIHKICIENPIGVMSTKHRKPDQIIHPYHFGHSETKATCLWLKNLPRLNHTYVSVGRKGRIHNMAPSKDRGVLRSIMYPGIAAAMAKQWGGPSVELPN